MRSREETEKKLKELLPAKRFNHSLAVEKTAISLAVKFGGDAKKAAIAGLLHDCAKGFPKEEILLMVEQHGLEIDRVTRKEPELLHGVVGAWMARHEFEVCDEEILQAIHYHTTGRENMSLLEKILYLADLIEPGRDYPGVDEIRRKVEEGLDEALILAIQKIFIFLLSTKRILHPRTIDAWNDLMR